MKSNFKYLVKLFTIFFKIGAFTFGGGHAMIPLIKHEVSDKHKYIDETEILDMVAVSESTPGPVAINMATFVGCRKAGFLGAVFATLGVVLPSFIIILVISQFLRQFRELEAVQFAFNGIRAAVIVLVANALISLFKQLKRSLKSKSILPYCIMAAAFILVAFADISALIVIISGAAIGIAVTLISRNNKQNNLIKNGEETK